MWNHKILSGIVALTALAATNLALAQRSVIEPRRDPIAGKPPNVAFWGHGKGELLLPVSMDTGAMSGVLIDNDGVAAFRIEARLTGGIPAGSGNAEYWFGGIEGRILKLSDLPPGIGAQQAAYAIDGMWHLDKYLNGTFDARAMAVDPTGRLTVAGTIYGRFSVAPSALPAMHIGVGDAVSLGKLDKNPLGDAWFGRCCPPVGDAGSNPRKNGKTPLDEARSKRFGAKLGDAAEPGKGGKGKYRHPTRKGDASDLGDVDSLPKPPMAGFFNMRFVFYD